MAASMPVRGVDVCSAAYARVGAGGYKTVQRNLDVHGLWPLDKSDSLRFAVNKLLAQPAMASSIYEDGAGRREGRSVFPFSPIGRVVWEYRD
jgi:hypothetical protein